MDTLAEWVEVLTEPGEWSDDTADLIEQVLTDLGLLEPQEY